MQEPLQITFHNLDHSDALEARVRDRAARMERYYDGVIGCRVSIEGPHKQPHKSTLAISITVHVPGRDLVASREGRLHEVDARQEASGIVNEAFDAIDRQLEEFSQKQRRDVKTHDGPLYARVVRLYPQQDYGFIETPEGVDLYFHRVVVRDDKFDQLEVGSEVYYDAADEEGAVGPQASSIQIVKGAGPLR
ncbi:MAG TPA: HPF/RaiA family ribosome-associated protein [Geminicoccaceae bacterium]